MRLSPPTGLVFGKTTMLIKKTAIALALASLTGLAGCQSTAATAPTPKSAASARQAAASKIFASPYQVHDLANGLRVILVKTDFPDVVSLQIPVQTGSRNEVEPGKSGFAHFFEHMMFRGTENYSSAVYGDLLKKMGGDQNAYTTDDYTNYYTTFTKADLQKMLELEADRFQNLKYAEAEFRTEALAVKGEYLKNSSNPIRKMIEVIRDNAFERHTYKHTTMGFLRDIEDMPNQYDYSKVFYDRWYRPEYTTLIVSGDIDEQQTLAWIKQYWGGWQRGSYSTPIPEEPAAAAPKTLHEAWPSETQSWLMTAYRGPAFNADSRDSAALAVIRELYFGNTSPLYQKLVINERKLDQLFAYFPDTKDPGLLYIGGRLLKAEDSAYVRDEIAKTLAIARAKRVDERRLAELKSNLKYSFAAELNDSEAIASTLAQFVHFDRDPETVNRLYQSYDRLSAEDVRLVAEKYFVDQGRTTLTLGHGPAPAGFEKEINLSSLTEQAKQTAPASFALLDKRSSNPLVDVQFLFNTGAAFDPAGKKGLAALTAAMLTEAGSKTTSYNEFKNKLYPLAAGFSQSVDKEMSSFGGTVHKDNLAAWYALVREQLLNPGFQEQDFKRVKTSLKNAIETNLKGNNDEELGKEVLYSAVYKNHPYGSLTLGDLSDIEALTLADVEQFYKAQYRQANLTLAIAGAADDAFLAEVKADFSALPAGEKNPPISARPAPLRGQSATLVEKQTQATAVSFGFPISVKRGDPDYVALLLTSSFLGEHRNSSAHLYQRLREARGMNYGDYAYVEYFPNGMFLNQPPANVARNQQLFQIWLRPLRSNLEAHFATRAALFELDKLRKEGMSEQDFEASRQFLDKYTGLLVKSQARELGYALDSAFYGTPDYVEYVRAGLKSLTREQVNAAINKHLSTEHVHFVYVTADAKDMAERLSNNTVSPMVYNSEKPAELLAEDKLIENLPLKLKKTAIDIQKIGEVFR